MPPAATAVLTAAACEAPGVQHHRSWKLWLSDAAFSQTGFANLHGPHRPVVGPKYNARCKSILCSRPVNHASWLSEILDVDGTEPLRKKLVSENVINDDPHLLLGDNSLILRLNNREHPHNLSSALESELHHPVVSCQVLCFQLKRNVFC